MYPRELITGFFCSLTGAGGRLTHLTWFWTKILLKRCYLKPMFDLFEPI